METFQELLKLIYLERLPTMAELDQLVGDYPDDAERTLSQIQDFIHFTRWLGLIGWPEDHRF